jgi:hypothetical protein
MTQYVSTADTARGSRRSNLWWPWWCKVMKDATGSDTLARLAFDRYGNSLPSIASPGDYVTPAVFGSILSQNEQQQPDDQDPFKDLQ